jgi:hypothetical protein
MLLSIVSQASRAINSRRAGTCGERGIADYRIICVVRRADGHIRAVGYSEAGNALMYDDLWTLEEVRNAIQHGHRLYAVSPSSGVEVELELHGEDIRAKPPEGFDHDLDDLPACG